MNTPRLTDALWAVASRDLLTALRHRADLLTTLIFFAIVASLFPLGVGSETALLRLMGPGVVWVAALLASMLALTRMFASDYADGTLEQLALSPHPLTMLVLAKIAAHWLASGLPLVIIAPLLGLQFDLSADAQLVLLASLLLGTPTLSLIGAVGAALTLGVRGGGALLSLLVLPLYVPVLIFGAGAVEATAAGLGAGAHLSLLGALLLVALVFAPWATAVSVRIAVE
jgi:heme exporter protein B